LARGDRGETRDVDVATLARGQAVNRVAIGTGLILLPRLFARPWVGGGASDERARVLGRSLGARDLALGAAGLLALRDADPGWARRAFAAQAFADAVDAVAIAGAGRVGSPAQALGVVLAAGSAAVAALYARELSAKTAH
jgi:hypothetical protein